MVYTKMDPLTQRTANWLAEQLRHQNPHRNEPTNIQLAWSTGYLLGLLASLMNDDSYARSRVIQKFKQESEQPRSGSAAVHKK